MARGLDGAVASLTRPAGPARLIGAAPHDDHGRPLDPIDVWGHDHCWWLDRMVRSTHPLVERMTLIWPSWFATSLDAVARCRRRPGSPRRGPVLTLSTADMTVAGRLAGIAVAVLAGIVAIAPAGAAARRPPAAPARLLVYAQEWSLWPSRVAVTAGPITVQLWDRGQHPNNLRIQRLRHGRSAGRTQAVATTDPGHISDGAWQLAPGTYELYCSLPGHAHAGMHTRLLVR